MPLRLVPPTEPSPKEQATERVKRMARAPGTVQCPRCGSRTSATLRNGSFVNAKGRVVPGTLIAHYLCADCYRNGIEQDMLPELKRIE